MFLSRNFPRFSSLRQFCINILALVEKTCRTPGHKGLGIGQKLIQRRKGAGGARIVTSKSIGANPSDGFGVSPHIRHTETVKDDMKLLAQCQCEAASHLMTEDAGSLVKYLDRLRALGRLQTQAVTLKSVFDVAWFENGQSRLVP